MSPRHRALATTLVISALVAASCGGGEESQSTVAPSSSAIDTSTVDTSTVDSMAPETTADPTTTAAPTTTISIEELATAYSEPGPFPVGATTLQLAKGPKVEIWYPAVEGTTGEVAYDVRDFVPEAIRALLTADIPASFSFPGARDAAAAEGTFPVVLFSHGFTGIRLQSSFLTSHLASWGMIVAAPDHPSRDLPNVLGATASGDRNDSVDDLIQTLELVLAENDTPTSLISGRVDPEHIVAVGHSAGGGTVVGAAADERIDGYVSMASGVQLPSADATATTLEAPAPLPDKPSFFIAGAVDEVISASERTRPSFEAVPAPSLLWILDQVGHNGFDDFCTFGNGTGIIGIAEASGLGPLLDAQPQLRTLGEDGCLPPAVPAVETFPVVRHAVTSWIRSLFGVDPTPVGLGPEVADAYSVAIEIDVRP